MTEGRSEQVGGIALGLSLDTAGFSAGVSKAKAELASLESTPVRVRAEIAVPKGGMAVDIRPNLTIDRAAVSGFKAQIDAHLKGLGEGAAVPIQITLGRINYGAIRAEIAAGIGEVPIKVTVAGGKNSPAAVVAATVSETSGVSNQDAMMLVRTAGRKRGLEPRAMGGPVRPGGRYVVGENGPEELTMHNRGGYVRPMNGGGRTRLWRGDTSAAGRGVPDWVAESPEHKAMLNARGRWFTDTRERAQHYADTFGDTGRVTSVSVGRRQLERYRVANQPEALAFSAAPDVEWFLPRHIADRARQLGGPTHAGVGARAYRQTLANEGGTFGPQGQPSRGYAVATQVGTFARVPANDPRAFIRAYRDVNRMGSPFVGTWMHDNMIDVDPSSVVSRKRQADLLARRMGQEAYFDLSQRTNPNFESTYVRPRRGNPATGQMGMGFRAGGMVHRDGGGVARRGNFTRDGRPHKHRIPGEGTVKHYHGGTENHEHRDRHPLDIPGAKWVFREDDQRRAGGGFAAEGMFAEAEISKVGESRSLLGTLLGRKEGPAKARSMSNEGMTMSEFLATASPEDKDFLGNLRAAHARLQEHHIEGGKAWYRIAGDYGKSFSRSLGIDERQGVGVLAALSAGTEWEANKTKFETIMRAYAAHEPFPYEGGKENLSLDAHRKARAILWGGMNPTEAFKSSPKVGQFFPGMMGDLSTLTIDRWALRTATRGKLSQIGSGPTRSAIETAWRQVAAEHHMEPAVSQAALWLLEKEESGQAPGQAPMGLRGGLGATFTSFVKDLVAKPMQHLGAFLEDDPRARGGFAMAGARARKETPFWRQTVRDSYGHLMPRVFSRDEGDPRYQAWARGRGLDETLDFLSMSNPTSAGDPGVFPGEGPGPFTHRMAGGITRKYVVHDPDGIHGRPSQYLAGLMEGLDVRVSAMNASLGNGRYGFDGAGNEIHDWYGLNARKGHRIHVEAEGPDAERAHARIKGVLGFDPYEGRPEYNAADRAAGFADFDPGIGAAYRRRYHQLKKLATGGYIVGERGPELFVPKSLEGVIPPDVMARLPKKAGGGIVEIGKKPFSYFAPPEDGWIIPNHLRNRIPHAKDGADFSTGPDAPSPLAVGLAGFTPSPEPHVPTALERFNASARTAHTPGAGTDPIPVKIEEVDRRAVEDLGTGGLGRTAKVRISSTEADTEGEAPSMAGTSGRYKYSGVLGRGESEPGEIEPRGAGDPVRRLPRRVQAVLGDFQLPSARVRNADRYREEMEGGPQLIQGRSSVRSTLAGISSFVLGGRQASAEARHAATVSIRDLQALEARQDRVAAIHEDVEGQLPIARGKLADIQRQGPREGESEQRFRGRVDKASEAVAKLTLSHEELTKKEDELGKAHTALSTKTDALAKAARPGGANVLQNVASIGLATTGYGLLTQGISAAVSATMPAIEKWADQMAGFSMTTTRVTSALADDTKARHGDADAAIASASATAGLSGASMDYVTSALKASTLAKAGAKAQGEASDLYRAVLGTGGGAGAPQGLFQGYGGIGGSAIGAEFLGGGKGFGEQVVADFSAAKAAETPTRTLKDDWMTSGIPGLTQIGQALGGRTDKQILSAAQVAPEVRESMRTDLNAAADRAANAAGQTASDFALVNDNTAAAAAAMKVLGDNAQDGGVAAGLAADGLAVVNKLTGQVVTDYRDYVKFLSQADTGRTIVDFADVVRQSARQLRAAFAGIDARLDDALKVGIPAQIAQQAITSPLIAPSAGIVPTGGLGGAVGAGAGPQVTRYLGLAQASQNDVKDMQQAGFEAMGARVKEFEPGKLKEFNTELGIAKDYATQVQLVTKAISLEQANLSAKQFTDQMFYLNRQLSDAKGLAGQAGGANNLGALQRQSFMIGREQTSLGLGLQQRQITTAVAVAGFQAPGESGEERYARREEALAKARIEQRQLNLSRRQFGVQGQIFNVSAARGVGDAQRSISMANAERKTSLDVAAGATAIANAERAAAGHLSKATAIYDAASQKFGVGLDETVSLMAQYGKTMKEANDALQGALKDLLDPKTGIAAIVANAVGAAVTPTSTPGVGGVPQYATKAGPPAPKHGDAVGDLPGVAAPPGGVFVPPPSAGGKASGFLGMTGGRTTMTVGEAGRETVAILRNPRQMMMGSMGGGGGGGGVTVIVTGNTFSGREDEQRLIQRITRAVEQGLGRKGQLMGLRGPAH